MATDTSIQNLEPLIEQIVNSHFPALPSYLFDDCMQVARIAVWMKLDDFDPDRGELDTYVRPVVRNAVLDEIRRVSVNHQRDHELGEADRPVSDFVAEDAALARAIFQWPERFLPKYLAKVLRAIQSTASFADAAKSIGVTQQTFWTYTNRLRTEIKSLFNVEVEAS